MTMDCLACSRRRRATFAILSLSLLLITATRRHTVEAFATTSSLRSNRHLVRGTTACNSFSSRNTLAFKGRGVDGCAFVSAMTRGRRSSFRKNAHRSPRRTSAFRHFGKRALGMMVSTQLDDSASGVEHAGWRMDSVNARIVNVLKGYEGLCFCGPSYPGMSYTLGLMVQYYGDRTYARFYALETIARVPYFGYLCVLHLYETLGQWRKAEYLKVHFAESYNELHHLLIMEELGGNLLFKDRWFAQHAAFFYFFVVVMLYLANPKNAYNLNQHVEEHAFLTYDQFLADNGEELMGQPAPMIAKKYYGSDKLYVFNGLHNNPEGHTFEERDANRPVISNLFDTFVAVRNDEWEHVKTMKALQEDAN